MSRSLILSSDISELCRCSLTTSTDDRLSAKPASEYNGTSTEALGSRIINWIQHDEDSDSTGLEQQPSKETPDELPVEVEADGINFLPDDHQYQEALFESPSYQWLLSSLVRDNTVSCHAMNAIRSNILAQRPRTRQVSRRIPSEVHSVCFKTGLDSVGFVSVGRWPSVVTAHKREAKRQRNWLTN